MIEPMYKFLRPLFFRLDPETAHHLTLQLMRIGGFQPIYAILQILNSVPKKPVHAFGLKFRNPVGLAAGYDKDGIAMRGLAALGFGHIEIGTVTPLPQLGNPLPRVFRLPEDEAVINRMGFPSRGAEFVQMQLNPRLKARFMERARPRSRPTLPAILGINLGKNKDTLNEEAVLDYLALLQNFAPYADYLTINVSSPNTAGLRRLQGREALLGLLTPLHQQCLLEQVPLKRQLPLLVKIAPDLTDDELDDVVDVVLQTHMDGIIATNTTLARPGLQSTHRDENGGLSGAPLRQGSEAILQKVVKRVGGRIPIVSAGGIMGPDDAKRRLDMGATLVQVYTGLIYRGPGLVKAIVRSL